MNHKTTRAALAALENAGLLESEKRHGKTTIYRPLPLEDNDLTPTPTEMSAGVSQDTPTPTEMSAGGAPILGRHLTQNERTKVVPVRKYSKGARELPGTPQYRQWKMDLFGGLHKTPNQKGEM